MHLKKNGKRIRIAPTNLPTELQFLTCGPVVGYIVMAGCIPEESTMYSFTVVATADIDRNMGNISESFGMLIYFGSKEQKRCILLSHIRSIHEKVLWS
jgi:hypothetical protein